MSQSLLSGRLLESLTTWKPLYVIKPMPPQIQVYRHPVFSARLGACTKLRRVGSEDSVATQISLLSCSSYGKKVPEVPKSRRRRGRRKPKSSAGEESIWVKLASKRGGLWNKMFRNHAMHVQMDAETEIFKHLPEEEKVLVIQACATKRSVRYRSKSEPRIKKYTATKKRRRNSASGRFDCRKINLTPSLKLLSSVTRRSGNVDTRGSVWHEESRTLDFDHKRELTVKVQNELRTTTSALRKTTGYGDGVSHRPFLRPLKDYPHLVEEDYSRVPKFPHAVRISPHLSKVIQADMAIRMGRPRYHEIRVKDLEMWNKGHTLDRSHRNLKVYNWLHSLVESAFDLDIHNCSVEDLPTDALGVEERVESVDEPMVRKSFVN